jgi:hypothetical protein
MKPTVPSGYPVFSTPNDKGGRRESQRRPAGKEPRVPELAPWIPVAAAVLVSVVVLVTVARLPVHREEPARPSAGRFRRQLALVVLAHLAVLVLILTLPVRDELRAQLLSLFGLVFTAIIALSSTTFVSNAMAGLMLRSLGNFHAGDFVLVGEHFGRVTERGLLHTEIQTEDRDLVTVPNLFLITQPVRVVRGSGTIVSCELSLGYDVPRERLTALLQEAARAAELEEPFVLVTALGDFSVTDSPGRWQSHRSALLAHVLPRREERGVAALRERRPTRAARAPEAPRGSPCAARLPRCGRLT